MMEHKIKTKVDSLRSREYIIYLILLMGLVALMDQYLSGIVKTVAITHIVDEYNITESQFSWWEAVYLIPTFFIFILNGLNDIIGRKFSILILILLMGFSSLSIVFFTPSFHIFMIFYAIVTFTTVSNMWSIPISEESPATKRAKYVSVVYVIGLIPLQALLPAFLIDNLGLNWKWIYGVMFIFMIPIFILWIFMKETKRYETIKDERKRGVRKLNYFGLGTINKKDRRYIFLSAIIWGCWLTTSFIFYWAGHYFKTIHGYSEGQWAITLFGVLVGTIIGGIFGGWFMDRFGRSPVLIFGCVGLTITLSLMGFLPISILPFNAILTGFFISFVYTWIVIYIPEIFPTDRRGSCMGWSTTVARASYVIGPVVTAVLLERFPKMDWFWVVGGLIMLIPLIIVFVFKPHETKVEELEVIEEKR